ncbi:MAG: hypothetical protein U0W24_11135 [Bacteroidales bacterium]
MKTKKHHQILAKAGIILCLCFCTPVLSQFQSAGNVGLNRFSGTLGYTVNLHDADKFEESQFNHYHALVSYSLSNLTDITVEYKHSISSQENHS